MAGMVQFEGYTVVRNNGQSSPLNFDTLDAAQRAFMVEKKNPSIFALWLKGNCCFTAWVSNVRGAYR